MNIVIIGNGVAGVTVAQTIRSADSLAALTIITSESHAFYSRPRLVEIVAGKSGVDQVTIHPDSWYEKNDLSLLRSTKVTAIDTAAKVIRDDRGGVHAYDRLVIAAGASSARLPIPGADSEGVFTLRSADDALAIRNAADVAGTAVVIGGGLLGIETAHALAVRGVKTIVLEVFDRLLPRQLDHEGSILLQRLLEEKGLVFKTGVHTEEITRHDGRLSVVTGEGDHLPAGVVVISAGIRPNTEVAASTEIATKRGMVVDDYMRTSAEGIYACGDIAEHRGLLYGLWQPAREQGLACGRHIAGEDNPYTGSVLSARLKVAGIDLASIGDIGGGNGVEEIDQGDSAAGVYKKSFYRDGKLVGAILIGNVKEAMALQKQISSSN